MDTSLNYEMLREAVSGERRANGLRLAALMEPLGGHGASVAPAIFAPPKEAPNGPPQYETGKRWDDDGNECEIIVIDGVASQSNRHEAALLEHLGEVGLPNVVLEFPEELIRTMPSHLPRSINLLEFPHRSADTYLLDAEYGGEPVHRSEMFNGVINATGRDAAWLLNVSPASLLYGVWNSHSGSKRNQAKIARSWTSRIIGWHPVSSGKARVAMKSDPGHLSADDHRVVGDENDRFAGRDLQAGKAKGNSEKLSGDGYGPVPASSDDGPPAHPSFKSITREAVCSFAGLRQIRLGDGYSREQDSAARTLLAAMGLLAHSVAAESSFYRSGCDLVTVTETMTLVGGAHNGVVTAEVDDIWSLFRSAVDEAKKAEVDLSAWGRTFRLEPGEYMRKVISAAWPVDQQTA